MFQIPYQIDFAKPAAPGRIPTFKPGRGNAGWTVAEVLNAEDAVAFLAALPQMAWMPGTHRAAADVRAALLGQAQFAGQCAANCVRLATMNGSDGLTVAYKAVYGHARKAAHAAFEALPELRDGAL